MSWNFLLAAECNFFPCAVFLVLQNRHVLCTQLNVAQYSNSLQQQLCCCQNQKAKNCRRTKEEEGGSIPCTMGSKSLSRDDFPKTVKISNCVRYLTLWDILKLCIDRQVLKFIYSEKATKFYEIFTFLLTGTTQGKRKVKILQNFVAFPEYMNFTGNDM